MKSLLVSHSFILSSLYEVNCDKDSNGEPKSSESSLSPPTDPKDSCAVEIHLILDSNNNCQQNYFEGGITNLVAIGDIVSGVSMANLQYIRIMK